MSLWTLTVFQSSGCHPLLNQEIVYNWKYWRSLNLVVLPQTEPKIMNLHLSVAPCSVFRHHEHCMHVYQGTLSSCCLKYLNKAMILQIYSYNWQRAGASCIYSSRWHQAGPRVLLHALHLYTLCENNLVDFNLAVSTLTAEPPNLIPRQIFQLTVRCIDYALCVCIGSWLSSQVMWCWLGLHLEWDASGSLLSG